MRTLVVIPTYEEAGNIANLLRALRSTHSEADLLVVDDASPDGTADLAAEVGVELGRIDVIRRPPRSGLGTAYRDGFHHGLEHGYGILVSIDADLSHDPAALPAIIAAASADGVGLAIGSRYVTGGSIPNWPFHRRAMSRCGNLYASALLGVHLCDMTSGYRAYRAEVLRDLYRQPVRTQGYGALIEMAYRVWLAGARVVEVPITFSDRTVGTSKMSASIAMETFVHVTRLGIRGRLRPLRQRYERRRNR